MKPNQFTFNRRQLLRGLGSVGLTTLAPLSLLSACGGGGDDTPAGGQTLGGTLSATNTRETRTIQFDLSQAPITAPWLDLPNSASHKAKLVVHTAATLAAQRAANPVLRSIPDARLTHFLEGVDVPALALQKGNVWGTHPITGQTVLATHFIHVPTKSLQSVVARKIQSGQAVGVSPKLASLGVTASSATAGAIDTQIDVKSGPYDVVMALIFQHPSIMNLQEDLGAEILDRIENLPCASNDNSCNSFSDSVMEKVATLISAGGFPSTTSSGSWATLVPMIDSTTSLPVLNDDGTPVYTFNINPVLNDLMTASVKSIVNDITNDTLFQGTNWQSTATGPGSVVPDSPVANAVKAVMAGKSAVAATNGLYGVVCDRPIHSRASGVRLLDVSSDDQREVLVSVVNEFLKSNSVYVQYYDADGNSITNTNPSTYDAGDAYYNSLIGPQVQIMGVPLQGSLAQTSTIRFTMPDDAVTATLSYGSLGLGGTDAFSKRALMGSIYTLTLGLAIPTLCLTLGISASVVGEGLGTALQKLLTDEVTLTIILKAVGVAMGAIGDGVQSSIGNLSCVGFISGFASAVLQILLQCSPRFAVTLAALITSQEVAAQATRAALPIVGQVLWALTLAADIATIGETLIECLCCPAIQTFNVALAMQQTVVVSHDPNDYEFPATATRIVVDAYYDGGSTPVQASASLSPGQTAPVSVALQTYDSSGNPQGVKSGGHVEISVVLLNANGCVVGHGATATKIVNMPTSAATIPITITEVAAPLDAHTVYQHQAKLALTGSTYSWNTMSTAPTATVANVCQGNGGVCAWQGLTVHTPSGMAGYGYQGEVVTDCSASSGNSSNVIRGIFLGDAPTSGAKFSGCGEIDPIGIVYSPTGTQNFMLQLGSDGVHHLRSVDLTASSFDMAQTTASGRFSYAHDSLCVLGGGYVVGVNRTTHKIEILQFSTSPSNDDDNNVAKDFGMLKGGYGSRVGMLDTPVAVTAYSSFLYVLEQGNRRVQIFDCNGDNPSNAPWLGANGQSTCVLDLTAADPGNTSVVYLDIAVEGTGCIYVLSYVSNGATASDYRVDVYSATGSFVCRTTGVAAGNIAVDLFRNLYTSNYETISGASGAEPSLSRWLPYSSTPCGSMASTSALSKTAQCGLPAAALS